MAIAINTKDFIKKYLAEIDGVKFSVRRFTTAESIAISGIQAEAIGIQKSGSAEEMKKLFEKIDSLYYAVFDKPDEARKILGNIDLEGRLEIYKTIITGEQK